jgi:hypothetical protein
MKLRNETERRSGKDRRVFDDNIVPPDERNGKDRRKAVEPRKKKRNRSVSKMTSAFGWKSAYSESLSKSDLEVSPSFG